MRRFFSLDSLGLVCSSSPKRQRHPHDDASLRGGHRRVDERTDNTAGGPNAVSGRGIDIALPLRLSFVSADPEWIHSG